MEDNFTAREVATLVEELRGDFKAVAEVVLPLREDIAEVKEELSFLKGKFQSLEDAVRLSLPRISRLESKAGF